MEGTMMDEGFQYTERTAFQCEVGAAFRAKLQVMQERGHVFATRQEFADLYAECATNVRRSRRAKRRMGA